MTWPESYTHFPNLERKTEGLFIRPIHSDDSEEIRNWRNNQREVLRQRHLLTQREQDVYFNEVVKASFIAKNPHQVLVSVENQNDLVAYGGLVHISWEDQRAELSFLTNGLLGDSLYERYFTVFINYIFSIAKNDLRLHRIYTETYSFRRHHISILEKNGLRKEGELTDHVRVTNRFYDSILHGAVLV